MNLRFDFRICIDAASITTPVVNFAYPRELQRASCLRYNKQRLHIFADRRAYLREDGIESTVKNSERADRTAISGMAK